MPRKKTEEKELEEKFEYLGLDLKNIPASLRKTENLIPKFNNEKQYRQYKFVPIKDIEIFISSASILDTAQEKFKKARPIIEYLDIENNSVCLQTFLNILQNMQIEDVKKIEQEQSKLNKKIPFKIKFQNDYLWPIYYAGNVDKYIMIVSEETSDFSTLLYILKKQLSKRQVGKVFVPIINLSFSDEILKKSQIKKLEDYFWTLTSDLPEIYEVTGKNEEKSINIIGEIEVYRNIKSWYKIQLFEKDEAKKFYDFIEKIATIKKEVPNYFNFKTEINKTGEITIYYDNKEINDDNLVDWLNEQYSLGFKNKNELESKIFEKKQRIEQEKLNYDNMQIEYLAKEKQITTFLQCKKSFFGKFKYFFKYGKNKNKKVKNNKQENIEIVNKKEEIQLDINKNYKVDELIDLYKKIGELEKEYKNLVIETKTLLLKNENLKKKIENATLYINEIDKHKKSIFEFWKYSNKDQVEALVEGEEEEVNVIKNDNNEFNFEEDFEYFGKIQDRLQRRHLSKEETDSVYVANSEILDILNEIRNNTLSNEDLDENLSSIKKKIDSEDSLEIKPNKMRKHKEKAKDLIEILNVKKTTRKLGYKATLEEILEKLESAIEKISTSGDLTVYKTTTKGNLSGKDLCVFNINPDEEIQKGIEQGKNKINLYKVNLKEKSNAVFFTNTIFFDNDNKTLPLGMNLSNNVLIDLSKLNLQISRNSNFNILELEDEKDDFTDTVMKTVNILEYNTK